MSGRGRRRRLDPALEWQETRFLNPGDWVVDSAPAVLGTLLGSCVSITLFSPALRIGAMCHYVLPRAHPAVGKNRHAGDGRYGDQAFALMCKALRDRGADPLRCEAKLFGGGRMFDSMGRDVGARNVEEGRALLARAGIPLATSDVGKAGHRRLWFDLSTGEVLLRFESVERVWDVP